MKKETFMWGLIIVLAVAVAVLSMQWLKQRSPAAGPSKTAPPSAGPTASASPAPAQDGRVVAKIGDHEIRAGALEQNLFDKYGTELLSQMLDREAIQLEADAQGVKLEREEVDRELKRMQQGYENEEQYYQSMKEQLGMNKQEIREDTYYKLLQEKLATRTINISDDQIDEYMQAHPEEFRKPIQLHIAQIFNQSLEQADRTIELARSGKDFAELAKQRSLDTATANDGGDIGWVEEGDPFVPKPIMTAALKLKAGEISEPVKLDDRYAVIKLIDRKVPPAQNVNELREGVRKQLALQQAPPLKDFVANLRTKWKAQILDPALQP